MLSIAIIGALVSLIKIIKNIIIASEELKIKSIYYFFRMILNCCFLAFFIKCIDLFL